MRMRPAHGLRSAVVALALAISNGLVPTDAAAQLATWSLVGETSTAQSSTGSAVVDGKIYVLGSDAPAFRLPNLPLAQEFDPATRSWRDLTPLSHGTSHLGVTALNGKIYVAGGFTISPHGIPTDQFLEYDPVADRWQPLAPLPAPQARLDRSPWQAEST